MRKRMVFKKKLLFNLLIIAIPNVCLSMTSENAAIRKKAIIIGASSGMGREVAKLLSKDGYEVGLVARRTELLKSLQSELPTTSHIKQIDIASSHAREQLQELITHMKGLDLCVISISANCDNQNEGADHWASKERTINVDGKGFIALADLVLEYFKKQNHGHLVGISSTSGLRGSAATPVYSAMKSGISCYMEAQWNYMAQNNYNIHITSVVPGWVAIEYAPMGTDPAAYWEISVEQAGREIMAGIKAQEKMVYVPRKVWLVALLLKYLPDWVYNKYLNWL